MPTDFNMTFSDFDGNPYTDVVDIAGSPKKVNMTLRRACVQALLANIPNVDKDVDGEEKLRRFLIAQRINAEDQPVLKAEEITLLKKRIGVCFLAGVVGPALMALDPAS